MFRCELSALSMARQALRNGCGATGEDAGSNVLSVAFAPSKPGAPTMYVAWENDSGDDWTPAACNSYLALDLAPWF